METDCSRQASRGTMSRPCPPPAAHPYLSGGGRRIRRIIAEDAEWTLATIPLLSHMCLQCIAKNFEEHPIIEQLPPDYKAYVLERLSPSLPLHVTANLISDEGYWKRCCMQRWDLCDVSRYNHSWKRMFFERHLENIIEHFVPDVTDQNTVLDMIPLCKNYIKRLNISQLLPPVKDPQRLEEEDGSDFTSGVEFEGSSMDHFDFGLVLNRLSILEELHVVYRVKNCGMNFEWNMFEFTMQDCESLAKALKSCKTLKVLRLHQSNVEDDKCRLLVKYLLDHPSLKELDLSYNIIGDRGARAVGKLLNRSKLTSLSLNDNNISGPGAKAIAHALSKNTTLLSLNMRLNRIGDEGGQAIGQALLKNNTLLHLHLGGNLLTEPTATVLSQVLVQNTSLTSINLSCNTFGIDGGNVLEKGMSRNTTITECDIRLTEVTEESSYCISQAVRKNQDRARKKARSVE